MSSKKAGTIKVLAFLVLEKFASRIGISVKIVGLRYII